MSRKEELAKLKKQRTADELERMFDQFDEQVHAFEEKVTTIKKSIDEFEAKKIIEENSEEKQEDACHEDVVGPI
jgi:thiamine kinase-like enzyme